MYDGILYFPVFLEQPDRRVFFPTIIVFCDLWILTLQNQDHSSMVMCPLLARYLTFSFAETSTVPFYPWSVGIFEYIFTLTCWYLDFDRLEVQTVLPSIFTSLWAVVLIHIIRQVAYYYLCISAPDCWEAWSEFRIASFVAAVVKVLSET